MSSFPHWIAAATPSTTTKASTSSSGTSFLLFLALAFALFYFLFLRPNRRRQVQAQRAKNAFDLGDEVVAGGMVGTVVSLGDGEVEVEISDGVTVKFVPAAVQLRSGLHGRPRPGAGWPSHRAGPAVPSAAARAWVTRATTAQVRSPGRRPALPGAVGTAPVGRAQRRMAGRHRQTAASTGDDAWPDVSDNSVTTGDQVTGGTSAETGMGDGGVGPSNGDS